jgi:hypothetical protein
LVKHNVNLLLNAALLEKMSEGVVLLDANGRVMDYNRAALPWLPHCHAKAAELSATIKKITSGALVAPLNLAADFPATDTKADFHLCRSSSQSFAVFITPHAPSITLPLTAECAICLFPRQAEMYANDLALLLPRRHTASAVSNEELDYLAELTAAQPSPDDHQRSCDEKNSHC